MKRKIFLITALIICLSFVFSSCALLTLNEERRSKNIVATVYYTAGNGNEYSRSINRLRLTQTVNQVLNQYYNYYGSLPDGFDMAEEVDGILEQLCDYELTVLYAIDYLSQAKAGYIYAEGENKGKWNGNKGYAFLENIVPDNAYTDANKDVCNGAVKAESAVLTRAEFDKVIKNTNEQYETLFKEYLSTVEAEQKAREDAKKDEADEIDEGEDEKTLTPHIVKTAEEEEFEYDAEIEEITKRYPDDYLEFTGINEAQKNGDAKEASNRKDAWNRTKSALTKAFIDYDYLLEQALESMVIYEYKRELTSYKKVTEGEIEAYLQKIIEENKKTYKKTDDYVTAMNSSYDGIYYHKNVDGKYFYVRNIVLTFDEATLAAVNAYIQNNYKDADAAEADPKFVKMVEDLARDIKVNVSNIFYDPNDGTLLFYKPDESFFSEKELEDIEQLKAEIADEEWGNAEFIEKIETEWEENPRIIFLLSAAVGVSDAYVVEGVSAAMILDIYAKYMEKVEENRITNEESDLIYAKNILEAFDAWFYALNEDGESSFNSAQGYFVYEDVGYYKSFLDLSDALYESGLGGIGGGNAVGNYYYEESGKKAYGKASRAGYHMLMISYVPFGQESDVVLDDGSGDGTLGLDHILDYYADADNDVRTAIKNILQEESDNNLYFVEQRSVLRLKDEGRARYETVEKNYKDLKKSS
ncbi:MAG: hypothetical protein LBP79_06260 [Clostridiales bacterium]|jgi:hypothetical protein|nr:hypothetical protein [Clostridiales bacterium]